MKRHTFSALCMFGAVIFGIVTLFIPPHPVVSDDTDIPSVAQGSMAPPPPRGKIAAADEDPELVRTRAVKAELLRRMDGILALAKKNGDSEVVEQAEIGLEAFRTLFVAAAMAEVEPGVFRYTAFDPCRYQTCFAFVVAERFSSDGSVMLAAFSPELGSLTVSPHVAESDGFQPYVVFHELVYVSRLLLGERLPPAPELVVEDAAIPAETYAHWFESQLMNAATGGRYGEFIAATAQRVQTGDIETVRPRKITFVAWPEALDELFEDHERPLSLGSRSGLLAQATIDLNHALIDLTMPPGPERDFEHEGVYANLLFERQDPSVVAFNFKLLR